MLYYQVQQIISKYAPEMAVSFADKWERFPVGGNAAMIVNYLNDKAQFYYSIGCENIGVELVNAATEIIVRIR